VIVTNLPARVSRIIHERNLFTPGDTIIVALSGGADSCALLDILAGLRDISANLVVAHLNHCLRGAESDADEQFCRKLAEQYALPFESRRIDVADLARREGLNLEDAGRRARIAFLDEIRTHWQASAIALAHHADDQAETVLMRLLRGSGATGLSGMSFRNGSGRIRPLLTSTRTEIEAYLRARGLKHREDASNRDTAFLRNRIRHELLPVLAHYNPAIRERLVTTAALLADEDDLLERMASDLSVKVCAITDGGISCSLTRLKGEHPALRRRLFRKALANLAGDADHFSQCHIRALEQLADSSRPNAILNLPREITALREYGALLLRKSSPLNAAEVAEVEITAPGHYHLFDGSCVTLHTLSTAPLHPASLPSYTAVFDLEKSPFPWHVRTFRPGDRIHPFGMAGSKKLKDLFIDLKIPLTKRRRIPLFFSGDTLIWVCGIRTSRLAAVDDTSKKIIMAVYSYSTE
jgi:tRNA(Ile)-lysidine synthase